MNIACVDLANSLGLAAKFTGSGGAIICLPLVDEGQGHIEGESNGWLSLEKEDEAKRSFSRIGYTMVRVEPVDE